MNMIILVVVSMIPAMQKDRVASDLVGLMVVMIKVVNVECLCITGLRCQPLGIAFGGMYLCVLFWSVETNKEILALS